MYKLYLLAGNSIEVRMTFDEQNIDLVVNDPPYLVNYRNRSGRTLLNNNNAGGVSPIFEKLYRVLKGNSYCVTFLDCVTFLGWQALLEFASAWQTAGFECVGHVRFATR